MKDTKIVLIIILVLMAVIMIIIAVGASAQNLMTKHQFIDSFFNKPLWVCMAWDLTGIVLCVIYLAIKRVLKECK